MLVVEGELERAEGRRASPSFEPAHGDIVSAQTVVSLAEELLSPNSGCFAFSPSKKAATGRTRAGGARTARASFIFQLFPYSPSTPTRYSLSTTFLFIFLFSLYLSLVSR